MNPYLARLRGLNSEKGATTGTDKTDKTYIKDVPDEGAATPEGGFEGFVGVQGRPVLENHPSPYARVFAALEARCPDLIEPADWQQAAEDARRFLATWGERAEALGWTPRDLFGLHKIPDKPRPSYRRLSRYDETGLVWLLDGRPVVALTEATAAIQSPTGTVTTYRKLNKPALGPVGDSLDDFK
jgi:hypothetical protein